MQIHTSWCYLIRRNAMQESMLKTAWKSRLRLKKREQVIHMCQFANTMQHVKKPLIALMAGCKQSNHQAKAVKCSLQVLQGGRRLQQEQTKSCHHPYHLLSLVGRVNGHTPNCGSCNNTCASTALRMTLTPGQPLWCCWTLFLLKFHMNVCEPLQQMLTASLLALRPQQCPKHLRTRSRECKNSSNCWKMSSK